MKKLFKMFSLENSKSTKLAKDNLYNSIIISVMFVLFTNLILNSTALIDINSEVTPEGAMMITMMISISAFMLVQVYVMHRGTRILKISEEPNKRIMIRAGFIIQIISIVVVLVMCLLSIN